VWQTCWKRQFRISPPMISVRVYRRWSLAWNCDNSSMWDNRKKWGIETTLELYWVTEKIKAMLKSFFPFYWRVLEFLCFYYLGLMFLSNVCFLSFLFKNGCFLSKGWCSILQNVVGWEITTWMVLLLYSVVVELRVA